MDSASTSELAAAVELAYACCNETEEAWEISVDVGSNDGLFIGGDFDPRAFGELTSMLREVRQRVEHPDPLEVERVRASLDRLLGGFRTDLRNDMFDLWPIGLRFGA